MFLILEMYSRIHLKRKSNTTPYVKNYKKAERISRIYGDNEELNKTDSTSSVTSSSSSVVGEVRRVLFSNDADTTNSDCSSQESDVSAINDDFLWIAEQEEKSQLDVDAFCTLLIKILFIFCL